MSVSSSPSSSPLQRRQAQAVRDGASIHKKNYEAQIWCILNLKEYQQFIIGSKVPAILLDGGFCLLAELHLKGSEPCFNIY